jgi:hypothetical protein
VTEGKSSKERKMAVYQRPRQRGTFYLRQAVTHPIHVLVVLCLPFTLFFVWSLSAIAAFALSEIALVCMVSRIPAFQRWVDEKERAAEAAVAARTRTQLLMRITDTHRAELQRLEVLADLTRERLMPAGGEMTRAMEDCLGTGRLLATYVGGAIAYCAGKTCLLSTDRKAIEADMAALARVAAAGRTEAIRTVAAQRLRIARMRAARWDGSYEDLEIMHEQLSLIADLVRLMYECSAAPVQSAALGAEVERALASVQDGERTVRELVELLAVNDAPEPQVLEMGRRALAAMAEQAARLGASVPPPPNSRVRVVPPPLPTATRVETLDRTAEWVDTACAAGAIRAQ